ncbi:helix-turn-helix transcriptional regulator [Dyella solisilvae]
MRIHEVVRAIGLSRATVYAMVAHDQFPAPIPIGANAVAWLDSAVAEWMKNKIETAQATVTEPSAAADHPGRCSK